MSWGIKHGSQKKLLTDKCFMQGLEKWSIYIFIYNIWMTCLSLYSRYLAICIHIHFYIFTYIYIYIFILHTYISKFENSRSENDRRDVVLFIFLGGNMVTPDWIGKATFQPAVFQRIPSKIPPRECSHISHLVEKENHRLKSANREKGIPPED